MKKIILISGDPNSINTEILFKSWKKIGKTLKKKIYLISNYNLILDQLKRLNSPLKVSKVKNINDKKFPKKKYKTIIYLHGCAGIWKGTVKRMDFFAENGFAVIAPASMAREKYARSCNTDTNQGGLYRSVLKIRQIDAENAILNAKKLGWVDDKNIFLVGLSEGGITTATYQPKNSWLGVSGRIIEGWTCNAGWDEYRGVNSPYNEPILSIVAKYDPWFQADYLKGHCGQFLNKNSFSKSIIIDEDPILSKQHGVLHDPKIKKIAIDFLNSIIK